MVPARGWQSSVGELPGGSAGGLPGCGCGGASLPVIQSSQSFTWSCMFTAQASRGAAVIAQRSRAVCNSAAAAVVAGARLVGRDHRRVMRAALRALSA